MHIMTRNFDSIPPKELGYTVYAISATRPLAHRDIPVLWLFVPTHEAQIAYNKTKDIGEFDRRVKAILKQRAGKIQDWVKANSDARICLACWERLDHCHRRLVVEAIREASEKTGVRVTFDIG